MSSSTTEYQHLPFLNKTLAESQNYTTTVTWLTVGLVITLVAWTAGTHIFGWLAVPFWLKFSAIVAALTYLVVQTAKYLINYALIRFQFLATEYFSYLIKLTTGQLTVTEPSPPEGTKNNVVPLFDGDPAA